MLWLKNWLLTGGILSDGQAAGAELPARGIDVDTAVAADRGRHAMTTERCRERAQLIVGARPAAEGRRRVQWDEVHVRAARHVAQQAGEPARPFGVVVHAVD